MVSITDRAAAEDAIQVELPELSAVKVYGWMLLGRMFDEFVNDRIEAGEEAPHFHSGIGQEALSVAGVATLRPDDYLVYAHRGYAHLIAKGVSVETLMLDMKHKVGGSNDGFGGVLHVADIERGIPGRNGAFGTNFGMAAGLALAAVRQRNGRVAMLYYGEAAGARGPLYEALNLAVLWKLPLILVAENNGYSISSRTETLYPGGRMSSVWKGFEIPVEVVDGNDAAAVYTSCRQAVERARAGSGPSVIEGLTYRLDPHRPVIDEHLRYRSSEEIEAWRKRDPLPRFRQELIDRGLLSQSEHEALANGFARRLALAWQAATDAPAPDSALFEARRSALC